MTEQDRRTLIADAALRLIGSAGARGLTHRGVDAEAGLPQGSTSYYCRSRADLLALALRRHAELDHRALTQLDGLFRADSRRDLPSALSTALSQWIRAQERTALVARFELFLAASRDPQLMQVVDESRGRFIRGLQAGLKARGVRGARSLAAALIALIEGLLLERVRTGTEALSARELRVILAAAFAQATPR